MPEKTQAGNTYFPNTFQVPNVTVDRLATLLPDSAFKILIVACRKILGYEEHRRSLRDRISRSQFCLFAGVSNSTAIFGTNVLEKANILLPVGKPSQAGQEYELNLGQSGDYDWAYLETLPRRAGNPDPVAARNAMRTQRLQNELFTPDMAVMGGLTIRGGNSLDPSIEIDPGDHPNRGQGVIPIETQKPKTIKEDIDTTSIDSILFGNRSPRQIWACALGELKLQLTTSTFDMWVRDLVLLRHDPATNTFVLGTENAYAVEWLTNRINSTMRRTLTGIIGEAALVEYVNLNPPLDIRESS